jgi:hypothetical protein
VLLQERGDRVDQLRLGIVVDERAEQAGREETRALRLREDDVDDVVAGEVPGLAEERLDAPVVFARIELRRRFRCSARRPA